MNLSRMMETIKKHPEFHNVGMVLCHNGVVRGASRDGRPVSGLRIRVDHDKLDRIIAEHKRRPGIIEILVEINEDRDLTVGDDVMFLIVAGDIRDNVIPTLNDALNAIKSQVTQKTQFFI